MKHNLLFFLLEISSRFSVCIQILSECVGKRCSLDALSLVRESSVICCMFIFINVRDFFWIKCRRVTSVFGSEHFF